LTALLAGTSVIADGRTGGPAHRAARALRKLGARVELGSGVERLRLAGSEPRDVAFGDLSGPIEAQYAGLLGAIRLLEGDGGSVDAAVVRAGLSEGMVDGDDAATVLRCRDGWLVVRWREPREADLLRAALGRPIEDCAADACWTVARECRLLVAPVRSGPRAFDGRRELVSGPAFERPESSLRVVDWTSLWAGPWAASRLAERGALVRKVQIARRPDGFTKTPAGRRLLQQWDQSKVLFDGDARTAPGLRRLQLAISEADLLVVNTTPRVLPQLGFDDGWFETHAPRLSRVSIVSYEDPYAESPGLGEHASAVAGLLWRGEGYAPDVPRPWADPLAGAQVLLTVRAWEHAHRPPGLKARVSLEAAAAEVMTGSV